MCICEHVWICGVLQDAQAQSAECYLRLDDTCPLVEPPCLIGGRAKPSHLLPGFAARRGLRLHLSWSLCRRLRAGAERQTGSGWGALLRE